MWIKDTRSENIADTLTWFPTLVETPKNSSVDAAVVAAQQLTAALRNPSPATPLAPLFGKHRAVLDQLARIFEKPKPNPDASPPRVSKAQASELSKPPRLSVIIPAKLEPNRRYPDGSTSDKVFENITLTGIVMGFDTKEGFYSIRYNDGDKEDLDKNELNILIATTNTTNLKYGSKVSKKSKTWQKTKRAVNSALQLASELSARTYQPKSQ